MKIWDKLSEKGQDILYRKYVFEQSTEELNERRLKRAAFHLHAILFDGYVNCSMRAVALVFKKDGEKFDAKDVFPHKSRIYKDLLAGSELESYYCDSCEKILMLTDCTKF